MVDAVGPTDWSQRSTGAWKGHPELVRLLLQRGADACLNQPIHYAGQRGHKEICQLLVDAGAVDQLVDSENVDALAAYRAMYRYDAQRLGELLRKQPALVQVRQVD